MTSTSPKRKQELADMLNEAANAGKRAKTAATPAAKEVVQEADARFENIAANPYYQVMFSESLTPEQKKAEVAKALTFEGTKEQNKESIAAFELFKEYLQHVREEMAQEIIKLTDTEAFSELKLVYDDLNNSLVDFDDKMKPLTDIVDAIYTLRTNNLTFDAFKEIKEDRAREAELAAKRAEQQARLDGIKSRINGLNGDIATLGEDKALWGFGGVRKSAREGIANKNLELGTAQAELSALTNEIATTSTEVSDRQSKLGQYSEQKEKLRELLDISTDAHKERQKELVDSALHFVQTAKSRVASVREHLGKMNNRVENLFDANGNMLNVYAIMSEGIKDAEKGNQAIRSTLEAPAAGEDMIAKMTREQKKMEVEQHIASLDSSAADTTTTLSDLTSQRIRINTMKSANDTQINKARTMHTQGVAGVADRLSVVLQAVSGAALGESSAMAKQTLTQMTENTNLVAQKEVIRNAMGITEQNDDLMKAIDDLGAYGEVVRTATKISREGLEEMRGKLGELQDLAKGVGADIKSNIGINADVGANKPAESAAAPANDTGKKPAPSATPNPFKLKLG